MATLEERIAALEARLAATPLAAVPPMTIGELTNVPVPGSNIAAAWTQDVSSRIVQRFPTTAALKAWAAPVGAFAVALDTGIVWRRAGGVAWAQFTPWTGSAAGVALTDVQSAVISTLQIPADPGVRVANVDAFFQLQLADIRTATIGLTVAGVEVAQAFCSTQNPNSGTAMANYYNVSLHAENINLAVNTAIQVTVSIVIQPSVIGFSYKTFAGPAKNRIGATVFPKGY